MLKILIADSDNESIKIFQKYIKNSFPEIKNVITTTNFSEDFIKLISAEKINLIILDIRFFGVAAVKKIREIHERFPSVRFVLYGAYNDSEYIHKCLDFGVIDYLFRPIKPADFHRCIEATIIYFKKMNDSKKREGLIINGYMEKKYLFEDIFFKSLISGHLKDNEELYSSFKYFGLDFSSDYTALIVHIDHFKKIILTLDEMEKHVLSYKLLLIIERKLGSKNSKAYINSLNEINIILSGKYDVSEIVEIAEDIKTAIQRETNIRVTIGIGRSYEFPSDVWISYREAKGALRYRFHVGYNTVIHILFVEPLNTITYVYPIKRELRLITTAATGEYEYSIVLLTEIFDALKKCAPLPEMYLSKVVMTILISINRYLSEQNIKIQTKFVNFFPSNEIFELGDDIDKVYNYLKKSLKNFCEHIVKARAEDNKAIVEGARTYAKEKYFESFSLAKIATELGTTSEYLNQIFIEDEGATVFDYILNIRLTEAKRLMRETAFDDDVIAIKIGYEDGRHFKSVFKNYEGITTNEYRKKFNVYRSRIL